MRMWSPLSIQESPIACVVSIATKFLCKRIGLVLSCQNSPQSTLISLQSPLYIFKYWVIHTGDSRTTSCLDWYNYVNTVVMGVKDVWNSNGSQVSRVLENVTFMRNYDKHELKTSPE